MAWLESSSRRLLVYGVNTEGCIDVEGLVTALEARHDTPTTKATLLTRRCTPFSLQGFMAVGGALPMPHASRLAECRAEGSPSGVREPSSPLAREMAAAVLVIADQHARNGLLSVSEMRTFLRGSPFEAFGRWLSSPGSRGSSWKAHDVDQNGVLDLQELEAHTAALQSWTRARPPMPTMPPSLSPRCLTLTLSEGCHAALSA